MITDTLLSTTWWHRAHPLHHVIAEDVFRPEIYSHLVVAFRSTIERAEANRELRHTINYGAPEIAVRSQKAAINRLALASR